MIAPAGRRADRLRGIALISSGTILLATVPIFSKLVLADMSSVHFSFFWMCFGLSYTLIFSLLTGARASVSSLRREWRYLLAAGVSAFVWVILAFIGIKRLDPTVSIVFFNTRAIWGVAIGLLFLRERYLPVQYLGMVIIVAGVALNLVETGGPEEVVGTLATLGAALAYAVTNGLVKRFVARSGIVPALFARFTIPAIALFFLGAGSGIPFDALQGRTLLYLAVGSFIGPFLSFVLIYSSLRYLALGIQSFFQSAGLFFTAIFSYFVFAAVPTPLQIIGGVIVVAGMGVMSLVPASMARARAPKQLAVALGGSTAPSVCPPVRFCYHRLMEYPVIEPSLLVARLEAPSGRVRMVLDTDTYNEIDDQFAVVHALTSEMDVEAIYAAPFFNKRSTGPEDGMERSFEEIGRLLARMSTAPKVPVHKGSRGYLTEAFKPRESPAARDLVERAMRENDRPLYVAAIGAVTNVASAILIEPRIIERIRVVWLGGNARWWPTAREFNLMQDIYASRVLFDSGVPLVQIPCMNVTSHLHVSVPELEASLRGKSAIGDYLVDIVAAYHEEHFCWSKVIWDVTATAYLVNPKWFKSEIIHSPILTDHLTYSFDESRHFIRSVRSIDRDEVFRDVFRKVASA